MPDDGVPRLETDYGGRRRLTNRLIKSLPELTVWLRAGVSGRRRVFGTKSGRLLALPCGGLVQRQ